MLSLILKLIRFAQRQSLLAKVRQPVKMLLWVPVVALALSLQMLGVILNSNDMKPLQLQE